MEKELKAILDGEVAAGTVAGAALLVAHHGQETAYCEAGFADREKKTPFRRDAIVRLYSATKPITAAAALLLMERGQLDLGSPVSAYLPAFAAQQVAENGGLVAPAVPMTVKDLLCMTSGLPYGGNAASVASCAAQAAVFDALEAPEGQPLKTITTRQVADRLAACPLEFHPGKHWMYGTSADVLGAVIEVAAGMRFGEFLRQEFFEPLGMKDTGFFVPEEKQARLATVYQTDKNGLTPYRENHLGINNAMDFAPSFESGGAGLVSTLDDYRQFAEMLLRRGMGPRGRILSEQTVAYLTTGRLTPGQQADMWPLLSGYTYGNLMRVLQEPGQAVALGTKGEYGWDGWLGFYFVNSPADELTMLLAFQLKDSGTTPMTRRLRNVIWRELGDTAKF